MFLFDRTSAPYSTRDASFDDVHEALRHAGCHSPTTESLLTVFDAIKSLCMLEKLKNPMGLVNMISTEMLLQRLNGPDAKLGHANYGIENSGWYTELIALEAARLITVNRGSITIHPKLFTFTDRSKDVERHKAELIEVLHTREVTIAITNKIVKRIREQNLVAFVLCGLYAER